MGRDLSPLRRRILTSRKKEDIHIKYSHSAGFSLLEVLVSVLVLAIGLLGIASLQISALRYNQESALRTIVVHQINEIADRMRANPVGLSNGNYDNISGTPTLPTCPCTPAQIATRDTSIWNDENSKLLPSGTGKVVKVSANIYDVTMMWDSHRTGATGTSCTGNPTVDLTCITVRVEL